VAAQRSRDLPWWRLPVPHAGLCRKRQGFGSLVKGTTRLVAGAACVVTLANPVTGSVRSSGDQAGIGEEDAPLGIEVQVGQLAGLIMVSGW